MSRFLLPAFRALQSALYRHGFDLRRFSPAPGGIPDAALYGPHLQPWRSAAWLERIRASDERSLVTPERKYILWQLADQAGAASAGDFFECGVYRGGTARLLAEIAAQHSKRLHLFDTFEGMPDTDPDRDKHKAGDFAETSLEGVRQYLSSFANVDYHPGFIPTTFAGLENEAIAFAHVDLDIYEAIREATAFIYPRLAKGGTIVYDDYGLATCPGARMAVDEFFADKAENPIALESGQGLVIKAS
jgi:O-methyltransferase